MVQTVRTLVRWTLPMDHGSAVEEPYDMIFDLKLELGSVVSTVVSFICMYRGVQVYVQFRPSPFKLQRHCKTASEL